MLGDCALSKPGTPLYVEASAATMSALKCKYNELNSGAASSNEGQAANVAPVELAASSDAPAEPAAGIINCD